MKNTHTTSKSDMRVFLSYPNCRWITIISILPYHYLPKAGRRFFFALRGSSAAEGGIESVEIAGIKVVLHHAEGFKRASEVDFCE